MHELLSAEISEKHWATAIENSKDFVSRNKHRKDGYLLGRIFELVGASIVQDRYPKPDFKIADGKQVASFRRLMNEQELATWQPTTPDAIIFKKLPEGHLQTQCFVEYKVANWRHHLEMQQQFSGFERLADFMRFQESARSKKLLGKLWGIKIPRLIVPEELRFVYVTPLGRSASEIPSTIYGVDNFDELQIALTPNEMIKRIKKF